MLDPGVKAVPARRKTPPSTHLNVSVEHDALKAVLDDIVVASANSEQTLAPNTLRRILTRHPRGDHGLFSRSQLLRGFRELHRRAPFAISEGRFAELIRMRPVRTLSGVTPVTVFTKPYPCPGQCVFCPNDVRMPKSYLSDEPGAQRAEDNGFDPYLQTWGRLNVFHATGHPTNKIELIVLGGTWSAYPERYQRWFIKRCFDAMNDFGAHVDRRSEAELHKLDMTDWEHNFSTNASGETYNHRVSHTLQRALGALTSDWEQATWQEVEQSQLNNERGACRCVGLSLETRPDEITLSEVVKLRRLGCTKVQLGYQSLSDDVLTQNKRGHDVAMAAQATAWLRRAGFKIQAHWMPNLLGATAASDRDDFDRLFADPRFRPDELKAYPCSLIESAELMQFYLRKEWQPYDHTTLTDVIEHVLLATPRYCRLSRVIRDIPSGDIVVGNTTSNLRQLAEASLRARGLCANDIRAREIRNNRPGAALTLKKTSYETSVSKEVFIEWVDEHDRIAAFLRLCLPTTHTVTHTALEELSSCAIIRELHVYGPALGFNERRDAATQHQGLGAQLIEYAKELTRSHGYGRLAVISAVGTRDYYRKRGFTEGTLYQIAAI